MSLQLAAQHLASRGRGPDSMLVHMAPGEVKSLQEIARAHGGSLSVNPDTGLPEAGFLSSILPTIAGIGLTALSGGTLSPLMAGLLVGGGTGLVTGDLRKGLAAGLGAYGGAGIGSALSGAGATAAASELAATNQGLASQLGAGSNAKDILLARGASAPGPAMQALQSNPMSAGIRAAIDKPSLLMNKENLRYGMAALAPMTMQPDMSGFNPSANNPVVDRYSYNPGLINNPARAGGVGEFQFFNPVYTRMADGGTVQEMSDRNFQETLMANGGQRFADGGDTTAPKYVFDPITNTYKDITTVQPVRTTTRMPGYRDPLEVSPSPAGDIDNTWGEMTPAQQAAYYANNPFMSSITQALQKGFGYTIPGMLQKAFVPDFVQRQELIARGIDPFGMAGLSLEEQANVNAALSSYLESSMNQPNAIAPTAVITSGYGSPSGPLSPNKTSITGGLLDFSGRQAPAPVVDAIVSSNYDQGGFGAYGENVAPSGVTVNDAVAGISAADVAAAEAAAAQAAANAVSDAVVASDASSGVDVGGVDAGPSSDGGGGPDGPGGGSGDLARGGLTALQGAFARGGYNLGDYSDGGRLLRGPGDGVSDSIPASIAGKRPARLADGEFVVPARIVSELGNGSTEAGARKLYAMMDRIQSARKKSVGKGKVAVNSRADKLLPA